MPLGGVRQGPLDGPLHEHFKIAMMIKIVDSELEEVEGGRPERGTKSSRLKIGEMNFSTETKRPKRIVHDGHP